MTRNEIVAAAWALYDAEGLDAVTFERIAERLGGDVAQIESVFPKLVALTEDMVVEAHMGPVAPICVGLETAKTGVEALDAMLHGLAAYYLENPEKFRFGYAAVLSDGARVGFTIDVLRRRIMQAGGAEILGGPERMLISDWGESELPHGMHPRRLGFVGYLATIGFLYARDVMASIGTTLAHSDEQILGEIRRTVASGPNVLRQLQALNDASSELAKLRTESELVACAPALLRSALEVDQVALLLRREGALRVVSSDPEPTEDVRSLAGFSETKTVYASPWVFAPVRHDGELAGVLAGRVDQRELDRRDISRIEMFAAMTGLALENVRLYESLQRLVDRRTHQLRQAQELVAGIAHDLNTPVGAVHSAQDSLVKATEKLRGRLLERYEDLSDDRRTAQTLKRIGDLAATVGEASGRIEKTVTQLRSFVRLDEADEQHVDVHRCIEDSLALIGHRIPEGVAVVRRFSSTPRLRCAPAQLNQLFFNLIDNAIRAIEVSGTVTVATDALEEAIRVTISDTGRGIPEAERGRVFDPGFTTRGVGVGTGLGLAICHQIVKRHRGEIRLTSELGEGTTVEVTLPLAGEL